MVIILKIETKNFWTLPKASIFLALTRLCIREGGAAGKDLTDPAGGHTWEWAALLTGRPCLIVAVWGASTTIRAKQGHWGFKPWDVIQREPDAVCSKSQHGEVHGEWLLKCLLETAVITPSSGHELAARNKALLSGNSPWRFLLPHNRWQPAAYFLCLKICLLWTILSIDTSLAPSV